MKPEEFEVYVIPPNFMEGGTLFGGLLKTRNTVEAVILGLAVGVPVLHLPFSLTVRVVILCLTALPLVLLALIGVSGMSLSAFIRLFFCFLHNRRILSRDGTQGGKNGKTLLPSWAQQRKSDCEAEDPPLPKSRSRFSVDLKQRSVTQFKTFLQEEEAVQPLNALADYIPIEKIEHGVIYTRDHRYVKVVEVVPVNFLLRSAREQRSIIYSFISYLKIAPVKVQFKALTKRADINRHLDTVRRELEHEQDPRCRVLQEDYLKLIRQLGSREAITRRFFLIFEYEPLPGTKRGHEEEDAIASLQTAARTAANYLRQCGNEVISPENEDDATAEILYNILCRRASSEPFYQRVKSVLADYMASGRDINAIPVNEFYAPDSIDLTHGNYLCVDGLYYAYLLIPSDGYKARVPAGWLSLLVNAGDGIDLDVFLARQPKDRMVRKLGQQLRINRSKIKETSDTNTDFDDLDGAIRSGYFLKDGLSNNEDFYYLNLLITVTAGSVDDLEWKVAEMKKLLLSQDMDVQTCSFCQEQAFLDFEVYWDGDAKCVQVESGKPYTGIAPVKAETSGPASQPEATTPADDVDAMKQDIVDRTNALRRAKGIAALSVNDKLMQAAQVRANEMATHTVYSHTRPDGRKFNTATDCPYMAENIHRIADWVLSDQTLAERAVADWSASTTHNKNMVNPKLSEIGVGLARGINDTGDPCWYCVQLFLYNGYSITRVDTPANK